MCEREGDQKCKAKSPGLISFCTISHNGVCPASATLVPFPPAPGALSPPPPQCPTHPRLWGCAPPNDPDAEIAGLLPDPAGSFWVAWQPSAPSCVFVSFFTFRCHPSSKKLRAEQSWLLPLRVLTTTLWGRQDWERELAHKSPRMLHSWAGI